MSAPNYSLWQMVQYMAKLGTIGFGGPVALVGYSTGISSSSGNGSRRRITRKA